MEKTIGMRIKECRMKLGMTKQDLADALYIPKTTVSSYERDVVDMKMGIRNGKGFAYYCWLFD